jgi:hypothetical protein
MEMNHQISSQGADAPEAADLPLQADEKRRRTAALQYAVAQIEPHLDSARFWSAAVLCRFSVATRRADRQFHIRPHHAAHYCQTRVPARNDGFAPWENAVWLALALSGFGALVMSFWL